jgi:hypothetical protein
MATSNTGVIIKRSFVTAIPPYLEAGELAYSYVSNTMFIGTPDSNGVLNIGGQFYTQTIDAATSDNIANTLVKRDSTGAMRGTLIGIANTASSLQNTRNFSISGGDISASDVQFNGTQNVTLNASLNNITGLTPGIYGGDKIVPVIQVAANGRIISVGNTPGAAAISVGTVGVGNAISNVITNVTGINFDSTTGFKVDDLGSGNVKISLGSSFKTWKVNGQSDLVAVAEDTVRFDYANGIVITTNPSGDPQSIKFDGGPIYAAANAARDLANAAFNSSNNRSTSNLVNGSYTFSLESDGRVKFPDNTQQNTAFTGTAIDQYARDTANSASSGSAIDQLARDTANTAASNTVYLQSINDNQNTIISILQGVNLAQNSNISFLQSVNDIQNTNITVLQGVNLAQNSNISFLQTINDNQNTSISFLQSVNDIQNTNITVLQGVNLTQNASITALQGVNDTQNTRITTTENSVAIVYNRANDAFTQANVGATFVTTGGTVSGNVSITKNLTVTGNLNILGNTTVISVTEFVVDDPLLYLGANNYTSDIVDIGIIGHYNDGVNAHTGVFRDPNLKEWIFFKGYTPEVEANNLIDLTHPSFSYANVYASYFKGNVIGNSVIVNGLDLYSYSTSGFAKANSANVLAQAAFDRANSAASASIDQFARDTANTASSNTVYLQSVNNNQNTSISDITTYSTASYDKANSANVLAQSAFDRANTVSSNTVYLQTINDTQNTNITSINTYSIAAFAAANNRVLKSGDSITGTLNISSGIASTKPNTGSLLVTGGVGVSDSIYVGNRIGFSNTSNVSMVYQYYNAATNSLDTVFG